MCSAFYQQFTAVDLLFPSLPNLGGIVKWKEQMKWPLSAYPFLDLLYLLIAWITDWHKSFPRVYAKFDNLSVVLLPHPWASCCSFITESRCSCRICPSTKEDSFPNFCVPKLTISLLKMIMGSYLKDVLYW